MTSELDIAWFAGLLEGEGCFGYYTNGKNNYPQVALWMCDEDVIQRAVDLFGTGKTYTRKKMQPNPLHKPQWGYVWSGRHAVDIMLTVLPHMGARRTARIEGILIEYYNDRTLPCGECGVPFYNGGSWLKTCSDQCLKAARKKAQARYQKRVKNGHVVPSAVAGQAP